MYRQITIACVMAALLMIGTTAKAVEVDVTIKAASINTKNEQRDTHLRSADFFEVQKYPLIVFKSKKIVKKEVDLDVSIDPTLIGGLIAEVEGMIYDGSVKTQIMRLKQSLKGEI